MRALWAQPVSRQLQRTEPSERSKVGEKLVRRDQEYRPPNLYLAVYLVDSPPFDRGASSAGRQLWEAISVGEWPYDIGDDPSFFAARDGGPVTWGVCRPDVRGSIRVGDVVAFVAADRRRHPDEIDYKFCAALTVERLISYADIFGPHDAGFQEYLNLVARPSGTGWEHFEPALPPQKWHADWQWRITEHHGHSKHLVEKAGRSHEPEKPLNVEGHAVRLAQNYVVFVNGESTRMVLAEPVTIAHWRRGDKFETWDQNERSLAIQGLTLGILNAGRVAPRMLRTGSSRNVHRHIRRALERPLARWFDELRNTI